jgi:hypothetical protein
MTIDEIREQIAISLNMKCDDLWSVILDNTTPGHYGFEGLECQVAIEDIWVEIPKKTFTFKNGTLSFLARLGSSSEKDGVDVKVRRTVSGSGTFDFEDTRDIKVLDFQINEEIDLYEGGAA